METLDVYPVKSEGVKSRAGFNRSLGAVLVLLLNFNMLFVSLYSSSCKPLCVLVKGVINKRRLD